MANTRTSAKRARQALRRQERNQSDKSATKSAVKDAVKALQSKDLEAAKTNYVQAIRALGKAASRGTIPQGRASRKISRLTLLAKKVLPDALNFESRK